LLEAASSAKPIIATDVPGCHQVVRHEFNGLLCKPKSPEDLAEKMDSMANFDDATIKKLGENGRQKMEEEFDEKVVIDKYILAIADLRKSA
jgi:glycosyltransferase involved in cell wall biosynthesis